MSSTSQKDSNIILYHYVHSPYARRIVWYLALRGIPYAQCMQPRILPRPDLQALGVNYRRIPILTLGRDIYLDTRLILQKLDAHFPYPTTFDSSSSNLSSSSSNLPPTLTPPATLDASQQALTKLLSNWIIDGGIFNACAALIPLHYPVFKDPKYVKDREELSGRSWGKEQREKGRKVALGEMLRGFELLEGLLKDGREWILETKDVSIGDIEAIWPFHWLTTMPGALPHSLISSTQFPKTFAWISRFNSVLSSALSAYPKPTTLKGPDATQRILSSPFLDVKFTNRSLGVKLGEKDPSELKEGEEVSLGPSDTGVRYKDTGRLVGLDEEEIVVERKSGESGDVLVRIHAPRHGFNVVKATGAKL